MVLVATALERFWDPAIAGVELRPHIPTAYKGKTSRRPHPPLRVWSKAAPNEMAPNKTTPSETQHDAEVAARRWSGRTNHTPAAAGVWFYIRPVERAPPRTITRPQNEIRKRQSAKRRNQATPNRRNPTPAIAGVGSIKGPQTRPAQEQSPNETQKRGRATQGPGTPDEPHTRFGGCVVIVRSSSELTTKPPRNATYERNPPKPQPNEARPPAVHQTRPRRKTTGNADGTTHPPKRVCGNIRFLPSVKTHPTSTQTSPQYAQPPKPGVPAPEHDDRRYRVPHTRCGGCVVITCTLSQRENPRTKKGRAQPPATRNPIQEPATTVQKTSSTHPLRRVCGNFKFVILTQHPRPRRTNTGERRPTRQTNPTNGNESKPQCKPRTNPTPAEADILLNPHPPTKSMTPPTENMWPRVRGNPNDSTTCPPKRPIWPAASLRFSKSPVSANFAFGHFGQEVTIISDMIQVRLQIRSLDIQELILVAASKQMNMTMGLEEENSTIDKYAGLAMAIISDGKCRMPKLCK
ncbi:hypothetical protein BS47DRAFT_1365451 [Hydnum rufescens UP504]|uniref:Uncharacterized protein n=1 Tax=Hydnum rufescens UP504 TaxID=1448309 RepID=A0A9P6DS73_9AGAM|nr:hypothetical protein BS47DRAFT_1365451 [Hydnum rufescens UP504]